MKKNKLNVVEVVVGFISTNCYIVYKDGCPDCFIVDPGDNPEKILAIVKSKGLEVKAILLTHGHFDHIGAVANICRETGAKLYAYEAEQELLRDANLNNPIGYSAKDSMEADVYCQDGQKMKLADVELKVIATPGHTGGSVCYYIEDGGILFSGDTLFYEAVGRTDFPTSNPASIINSIREKLFTLPDSVIVLPGHGPSTSIEYEKENNPYVGKDGMYA